MNIILNSRNSKLLNSTKEFNSKGLDDQHKRKPAHLDFTEFRVTFHFCSSKNFFKQRCPF